MLVVGLLLVIHFFILVEASPSMGVAYQPFRTPPSLVRPPGSSGDPPAIPDSPFIENVASKYQYLLMLTESFYSTPESCNWNVKVDLNRDGIIDIYDAIIVAAYH
jgi:hypothetical protein